MEVEEKSECVAIALDQEEEDSLSPYVPSRFLCPSNLGALLESTTASLVSGGWKENDANKEAISSVDVIRLGRLDDDSSAVTNVASLLECDTCGKIAVGEAEQELVVNDAQLEEKELPRLIPPQPCLLTPPPLPRLSPLSVPRATVGEFHGPCLNSEVDLHRHHQLCIAIDEDSPLKCTPPLFHNHSYNSQRSSICSSTLNDGDNPKHDYRTHSRNVSETPSLPPFHSSSTSSAYHSRNSSLGSQLSSCFESDNMLNQLADMDSCIALHTGSHGDLMRKQDPRCSKQGDSSPSSYSSELSLHQHMSKPLDRKDAILKTCQVSLEDTLRNLSLEKMDKCRKSTSMKSSEWIKHQLECHKDSLVQVKVSSKTKHVVHFNVKAGDVIMWEFATKKRDISFGVFFEATEVVTEQSPTPESAECLDDKMSSILPIFRVGTHAHPTVGTHTASLDGIYEIIFDNTYSRFFAKELYYRITTQPSQPNANYFHQ